MEKITLKAQTRTTTGNSPARALRRSEKVPAILYGPRKDSRMLTIQEHELDLIVKRGNLASSLFDLFVDDNQTAVPVMIKELQTHPVTRAVLHVDLYEVAMDRKIRVNVPVTTTGKSVGVEEGGLLQLVRRELEVFCFPNEIPEAITIDVTNVGIGGSVHVEDIQVEGNVEIPHEVNFTILTVSATKQEAEVAEEEGAEAEGEAEETTASDEETA